MQGFERSDRISFPGSINSRRLIRAVKHCRRQTVPILQVFHRKGLISEADYLGYYNDVEAIARMLTKLIASVDALRNEIA